MKAMQIMHKMGLLKESNKYKEISRGDSDPLNRCHFGARVC